ncbi:MAG: hypothetical protein ACRDTV_20780, partial [Mycobacterium sp.]
LRPNGCSLTSNSVAFTTFDILLSNVARWTVTVASPSSALEESAGVSDYFRGRFSLARVLQLRVVIRNSEIQPRSGFGVDHECHHGSSRCLGAWRATDIIEHEPSADRDEIAPRVTGTTSPNAILFLDLALA